MNMKLIDLIEYYEDLADEAQRKNDAYMKSINKGGDGYS